MSLLLGWDHSYTALDFEANSIIAHLLLIGLPCTSPWISPPVSNCKNLLPQKWDVWVTCIIRKGNFVAACLEKKQWPLLEVHKCSLFYRICVSILLSSYVCGMVTRHPTFLCSLAPSIHTYIIVPWDLIIKKSEVHNIDSSNKVGHDNFCQKNLYYIYLQLISETQSQPAENRAWILLYKLAIYGIACTHLQNISPSHITKIAPPPPIRTQPKTHAHNQKLFGQIHWPIWFPEK